jgi:galactose mutarotase-like enzyme
MGKTGTVERTTITADGLSATIRTLGAELVSFADHGQEMLWQAGPAWPRQAPVLFPIVGRLKGDRLRHHGQDYSLTQHGFARDHQFAWLQHDPHACRMMLRDDAVTRSLYPFAFRFELGFSLQDGALRVDYSATNTGDEIMPVSMGAHPAFRWPLAPGVAKNAHRLTFEHDEPAPMPRVSGGLLSPAIYPSVIKHGVLALDESLFAADALILPAPASRWVRFRAPGAPGIEMAWDGFPSFGIWMRPGGDFLCLEPWHGMASAADWDGDFIDKPGLALLASGESLEASYTVRILPPTA